MLFCHEIDVETNLCGAEANDTKRTKSDIKHVLSLKTVSAIFLPVCFLSLKESTYRTWKNVFYFTSKALFILEKIKF